MNLATSTFHPMLGVAVALVGIFGCVDSHEPWKGWSVDCPLTVAPSRAVYQPFVWMACGRDCDRLQTPVGSIMGRPQAYGRHLVVSRAIVGDAKEIVVVDIESGRVEHVIRQPWDTLDNCAFRVDAIDVEQLAIAVRGDGRGAWKDAAQDGVVLFDLDRRALSVGHRDNTPDVGTYALAGTLLRTTSKTRRLEQVDGATLHNPSKDPSAMLATGRPPVEFGDAVYFEVGGRTQRAIHRWRPGSGQIEPFVRRPPGDEHLAGNLGGDDTVLVWSDQTLGDDTWIVSAHVNGDQPPQVRRLAADPNPNVGAAPFVVGGGRAAHWAPNGAAVVDLVEGAVSRVPNQLSGFRIGDPLLIDAVNVFFIGYQQGSTTVFRVGSSQLRPPPMVNADQPSTPW